MSTRESMRLELKELAKLAATMGCTPAGALPQVDDPASHTGEPEPPPERSLTSSGVTVPPVVSPSLPPPMASVLDHEPGHARRHGGLMAAVVGAALAATLFGGAVFGRRFVARAPVEPDPIIVTTVTAAAAPETPLQPARAPLRALTTPDIAPAATVERAPPSSPALPDTASPPSVEGAPSWHHRVTPPVSGASNAATRHATPKPQTLSPASRSAPATPDTPAPKTSTASPAASAPAAASAGESLEDLMRKAVANPSK